MLLSQQPVSRPVFNNYYYSVETHSPTNSYSPHNNHHPVFPNQWSPYPDMSDFQGYTPFNQSSGSSNSDLRSIEIKTEQLSPSSIDMSGQDPGSNSNSNSNPSDTGLYSKCTV